MPILVKCCLNGGTTREEHSAVPLTPSELAAEARAAVDAGAGALHLHVRIGLEDVTTLPDGRTAAGNAELVAAAIALARGRER